MRPAAENGACNESTKAIARATPTDRPSVSVLASGDGCNRLDNKVGRERIGRAGRRLILENYTWSQAATSYLDLISQALPVRSQSV